MSISGLLKTLQLCSMFLTGKFELCELWKPVNRRATYLQLHAWPGNLERQTCQVYPSVSGWLRDLKDFRISLLLYLGSFHLTRIMFRYDIFTRNILNVPLTTP